MNYTYIVKCADGTLYTGWTNDLDKRLKAHNSGKGAKYTRSRHPVELVYYEPYLNPLDAMRREYSIKQLSRQEKIALMKRKEKRMFSFNHFNFNVLDLEKSLKFYKDALDLEPVRWNKQEDFTIVYLGDAKTGFTLELTWLKDRTEAYNLGEIEYHLALTTPDMDAAHKRHEELGCICYENPAMGIYFIEDPDGYWVEILPEKY